MNNETKIYTPLVFTPAKDLFCDNFQSPSYVLILKKNPNIGLCKYIEKAVNAHEEMLEALLLADKLITGYVPSSGEEHMKIKNAIKKAQSC